MPPRSSKYFRPTLAGAGMTRKGVAYYRKKHPGSKLKTAVTGNPRPGSRDEARRKSFCARSAGQARKFPAAARNPKSRLSQARKRWKCRSPKVTKKKDEGLHEWFARNRSTDGKPGWRRVGSKNDGKACARQKGETGPVKCASEAVWRSMSKAEREDSLRRKKKADPKQGTARGKPVSVTTRRPKAKQTKAAARTAPTKPKAKRTHDACYYKVKKQYKTFPSAYASGAIVRCRNRSR